MALFFSLKPPHSAELEMLGDPEVVRAKYQASFFYSTDHCFLSIWDGQCSLFSSEGESVDHVDPANLRLLTKKFPPCELSGTPLPITKVAERNEQISSSNTFIKSNLPR